MFYKHKHGSLTDAHNAIWNFFIAARAQVGYVHSIPSRITQRISAMPFFVGIAITFA